MTPLGFWFAVTLIGSLVALDLALWFQGRRWDRETEERLVRRFPDPPDDPAWLDNADGWSPR